MIKLVSNYSFFNLLDLAKGATLAFLWGQFFYQMYKDGQLSSLEVCPLYIMKTHFLYILCTIKTLLCMEDAPLIQWKHIFHVNNT